MWEGEAMPVLDPRILPAVPRLDEKEGVNGVVDEEGGDDREELLPPKWLEGQDPRGPANPPIKWRFSVTRV